MKKLASNPLLELILKNIILAAAYMLLGRIALLLAIPPGYAMALYPPAGIALGIVLAGGYRLAPGVAIGSLLLNTWIGWEAQHALTLTSFMIACVISLGAMSQAVFGAWLVRRTVGYPAALDSNRMVLKFMLFGGLTGCLVGASVGIATLVYFGVLPAGAAVENWFTWWIGDTLGVLTMVPLCLVLFGEPRALWRSRCYTVMLPQIVLLLVAALLFSLVRSWEQDSINRSFYHQAKSISANLQSRLDVLVEIHKQNASLFSNFDQINKQQFAEMASHALGVNSAIAAVEWAPLVSHAMRPEFERSMRKATGIPGLTIRDLAGGKWISAPDRELYFPIALVEPLPGNESVFAFDVGSTLNRRATIEEARDTGLPVASEPLILVQETRGRYSSLLIAAAYEGGRSSSLQMKRKRFKGVSVEVVRVGEVLDSLLNVQGHEAMHVRLRDVHSKERGADYIDTIADRKAPYTFRASVEFAGRELELLAMPSDAWLAAHHHWAAWSSMVGGMLFVGLMGIYFLVVTGRAFQIESLIQRRTGELRDSRERMAAILNNAADGIIVVDADGRIVQANHAAYTLLGYEEQRLGLVGMVASDLFGGTGDGEHGDVGIKDVSQVKWSREVIARRADGNDIVLELSNSHLQQDGQNLTIVIMHDLTERKRADRLKGEFVSAVSHELRTPLTSIRGSLGLLAGGALGAIPDKAMSLIKLANSNAERLHGLINDILDFEKLEYSGMLFKSERHALANLLENAVEYNRGYAEKFSVLMKLDMVGCSDVVIAIDDARLIQVLSNFISNAIKFSKEGDTIDVFAQRNGHNVRISVRDQGIGISEEFRSRVFSKFSQADGTVTRKYAGTGLGLSLAKSMTEKMGGTIGFDSEPGHGATFFVEFPIQTTSQEENYV